MRKNILILGHNYATQFIDIYNQYTKLFDPAKFNVTVAFLTGEEQEIVRQRMLAENVLFLDIAKPTIRHLKIKAIKSLISLCRQQNYELIICHRYKPTYIMLWAALFHVSKFIFVMHELGTMSALSRRLLMKALFRKNMLLAGVSNAVRDDMRKNLSSIAKDHIITLYNMIDVDMTEPLFLDPNTARKKLGLRQDTFVFGNIARLAVNKDHQTLIQAFAMIKPHCPKAKLIIMGDGELELTLKEQVIASGLKEDIIFTGFLANGFQYLKAFDCFVLSSTQEAFGRVLLEAMLAKKPIIATKTHGIPEVMGDTGILIPARNVKQLASAMQTVYQSSMNERDRLGKEGYKRACSDFSIPKFHEQFWQLPLTQSLSGPL